MRANVLSEKRCRECLKLLFQAINLANTLDGLVARRADDTHEPFQKRYLTEQEAIEGPDDEAEAKVSAMHPNPVFVLDWRSAFADSITNRRNECVAQPTKGLIICQPSAFIAENGRRPGRLDPNLLDVWLCGQVDLGDDSTQASAHQRAAVQMPLLLSNQQVEGRPYSSRRQ